MYKFEGREVSVEVRCIVFEEFSMRQDSPIYDIITRDTIHNNNMTDVGPDWKSTWKSQKEKRDIWKCVNGEYLRHFGHTMCSENVNT